MSKVETKEVFLDRLDHLKSKIWIEDDPLPNDYAVYSTAKSMDSDQILNPLIYTIDDAVFRFLFGELITGAFFIISKNKSVFLFDNPDKATKYSFITDEENSILVDKYEGDFNIKIKELFDVDSGKAAISDKGGDFSFATEDRQFYLEKAMIYIQISQLNLIRNSARVAKSVFKRVYLESLDRRWDSYEKIKTKNLEGDVRKGFNDKERLKMGKLEKNKLELAFPPVVQLGKNIATGYPPVSQETTYSNHDLSNLVFGIKYSGGVSIISRTIIAKVKATEHMRDVYSALHNAHKKACDTVKEGVELSAVYRAFVQELDEKYRKYVPQSIGFFIGTMHWTSKIMITEDSNFKVPSPCALYVVTSLNDVILEGEESFTLMIGDTIQVNQHEDEKYATRIITDIESALEDVCIDAKDPESLNESRERRRDKNKRVKEEENLSRLDSIFDDDEDGIYQQEVKLDTLDTTLNTLEIPTIDVSKYQHNTDELSFTKIFIPKDTIHYVIFPVNGLNIPIHISRIKSITESANSIKISLNGNLEESEKDNPSLIHYIAELEYVNRTNNPNEFKDIKKRIENNRKRYKTEKERFKDKKSLYVASKQFERLPKEITNRPEHLKGLKIKSTAFNAKDECELSINTNAFMVKVSGPSSGKTYIFYENIKSIFVLPCYKGIMSGLFFSLRKPIEFSGKDKMMSEIFFYKLTKSASVSITKRGGVSEQQEEAEERHDEQRRKKINKSFSKFMNFFKDEEFIQNLDFGGGKFRPSTIKQDQPSIYGTVNNVTGRIFITKYALVFDISQPSDPDFILYLDNIFCCAFERIHNETFDIVFIPKDVDRENIDVVQITQVEHSGQEYIKQFLEKFGIVLYQSRNNLKWKEIKDDLAKKEKAEWNNFMAEIFYEEDVDEVEEDEFEINEDDHYEDDDDDDEMIDVAPSSDEDDEVVDDDYDNGKDWDELDREAERKDMLARKKERESHLFGHKHHSHHSHSSSSKHRHHSSKHSSSSKHRH